MENIYCVEHCSVLSTLHIFSYLTPQHLYDIIHIPTIMVICSFHAHSMNIPCSFHQTPLLLLSLFLNPLNCQANSGCLFIPCILTIYFLCIRDHSILISDIHSDNRCCMISIPLDPEISAPCFMSLGMFQCLLVYNLLELEWNLYPSVM